LTNADEKIWNSVGSIISLHNSLHDRAKCIGLLSRYGILPARAPTGSESLWLPSLLFPNDVSSPLLRSVKDGKAFASALAPYTDAKVFYQRYVAQRIRPTLPKTTHSFVSSYPDSSHQT